MKCYCYTTESDFILCVEDVETEQLEEAIQHAWFQKNDNKFLKTYPMKDMDNGVTEEDKECIKRNFSLLGPTMFESMMGFDWEMALSLLARKFKENDIEWYIIGSASEAVLGVEVNPHDLDIVVHTRDFIKVKHIFSDCVVEPFVDNKGTWLVRYFGRLCVGGAMIDIAADEKMNLENRQHQYESVSWNGFDIYIEPLQVRYQTELDRNRAERIEAIEKYMNS